MDITAHITVHIPAPIPAHITDIVVTVLPVKPDVVFAPQYYNYIVLNSVLCFALSIELYMCTVVGYCISILVGGWVKL